MDQWTSVVLTSEVPDRVSVFMMVSSRLKKLTEISSTSAGLLGLSSMTLEKQNHHRLLPTVTGRFPFVFPQ